MESDPHVIDDLPVKIFVYKGFPIATFDSRRIEPNKSSKEDLASSSWMIHYYPSEVEALHSARRQWQVPCTVLRWMLVIWTEFPNARRPPRCVFLWEKFSRRTYLIILCVYNCEAQSHHFQIGRGRCTDGHGRRAGRTAGAPHESAWG